MAFGILKMSYKIILIHLYWFESKRTWDILKNLSKSSSKHLPVISCIRSSLIKFWIKLNSMKVHFNVTLRFQHPKTPEYFLSSCYHHWMNSIHAIWTGIELCSPIIYYFLLRCRDNRILISMSKCWFNLVRCPAM